MGSRMLHKWLDKPLMDVNLINERLDFIECFNEHYLEKAQIKEYFKSVYDLERIIGRVASGNANAKDLGWLKKSLKNIPDVKKTLACLNTSFASNLANNINDHAELFDLLDKALVDNPPLIITEGGMIKEGFDEKLDEIKKIQANSKEWILNYEPKNKLPIEDFLKPQGRFKHLFKKENEDLLVQFQQEVDRRWENLLYRCAR